MNDNVRLRTLLKQESPSLNSQTDGVCISSRVRLARNVADQPFRRSLDREQQSTLTRHLLDICAQVLPSD